MSLNKKSFWSTIAGILTGVAALISAITGLYLALHSPQESNNSNNDYPSATYANESVDDNYERESINATQTDTEKNDVEVAKSTIIKNIRRIVEQQAGQNLYNLNDDEPLYSNLSVDFYDIAEILAAISVEYNIDLDESDVGNYDQISLKMIANAVERKID